MPTTLPLTRWAPTARPNPKSKARSSPPVTMTWKCCWSGKEEVIRDELDLHPLLAQAADRASSMPAKSSACTRRRRRRCAPSATPRCAWDCAWCATARLPASSPPATPARPWPPPRWCWARCPGVDRPALAAVFPTAQGTATILIDVGANVDSKPQNLQQFAIMGDIYFRTIFAGQLSHAPTIRASACSPSAKKKARATN